MFPVVDRLSARGYAVRKVNTEREPELARRLNVTAIPCFVVLIDGREYSRYVGATSESYLEQMLVKAYKVTETEAYAEHSAPAQKSTCAPCSPSQTPVRSAWRGKEADVAVADILHKRCTFPSENNGPKIIPISENRVASTPSYVPPLVPAPNTPAIGANASQAELQERILAATVRIHIRDQQGGVGCGTGTIIDCRGGRALILTCGHLFREFQTGDPILIDLFGANGSQGVEGRYIHHDLKNDFGLISIPVTKPVGMIPIAPRTFVNRKGMNICTAGCSYGAVPTIQTGVVTNINRYLGTPNIEVSALPVQGRSGGGIFTEDGYLIGVCFAANPEDKEGLCNSIVAIYQYLDGNRFSMLASNPRNESLRLGQPGNRMPTTMPEPEQVILLTDLPPKRDDSPRRPISIVENPEQRETASPTPAAPAAPAAPARPVHVAEGPSSLTGEKLPNWPPKWD